MVPFSPSVTMSEPNKAFVLKSEDQRNMDFELVEGSKTAGFDLSPGVPSDKNTSGNTPARGEEKDSEAEESVSPSALTGSEKASAEKASPLESAKSTHFEKNDYQGMLRGNVASLSKGRFHCIQKGQGIGKHTSGRGVGRATKLAHLEVAAEHIGTSSHALLTSPRLLRSPCRKKSPIRWFPRKKTESYLERKIRMLQEKEGKVASLDETLGGANLHFSRIERDKLAAQTAAAEAMEARKGALVEASWCRILKLAGIPCKLAILELQKAEKKASMALTEAENHGVVLQHEPAEREPASEAVTAALDTAFEVDKEVTAAIKAALKQISRSATCGGEAPLEIKGECPNSHNTEASVYGAFSETESHSDAEMKVASLSLKPHCKSQQRVQQSLTNLMVSRIADLSVDHHTALAAIVATRGLSDLLKDQSLEQDLDVKTSEALDSKLLENGISTQKYSDLGSILVKHVSKLEREVQASKESYKQLHVEMNKRPGGSLQREKQVESLDKNLVKHVSRLEKEKLAARRIASEGLKEFRYVTEEGRQSLPECLTRPQDQAANSKGPKDNGEVLIQGERKKLLEVTNTSLSSPLGSQDRNASNFVKKPQTPSLMDTPDLGSILVKKHMSRLQKEKQAFLQMQDSFNTPIGKLQTNNTCNVDLEQVENVRVCQTEMEQRSNVQVTAEKQVGNNGISSELPANSRTKRSDNNVNIPDLGSILVKHVCRLEKEKQAAVLESQEVSNMSSRKLEKGMPAQDAGLGDILVKRLSKLEIEKPRLSGHRIQDKEKSESGSLQKEYEGAKNKEDNCFDQAPASSATEHEISGAGKSTAASWGRIKSLRSQQTESIWGGLSLQDVVPTAKSTSGQNIAVKSVAQISFSGRKSLREKQMEDSWGGLSLGNTLKRHVSKLEMEQAAWRHAEEEAKQRPR